MNMIESSFHTGVKKNTTLSKKTINVAREWTNFKEFNIGNLEKIFQTNENVIIILKCYSLC